MVGLDSDASISTLKNFAYSCAGGDVKQYYWVMNNMSLIGAIEFMSIRHHMRPQQDQE